MKLQIKMNPFSLTKSADMPDELIDELWVDIEKFDIASRIKSLNPVFLIGGKGSGKTHLLRHYSYPLQKIRFERDRIANLDGVKADGYIGIYYRCKGLQASRFTGKGYTDDLWLELFAYAFELSVAHELIFILSDLVDDDLVNSNISSEISTILGVQCKNLKDLEKSVSEIRRKLDQAITNSALGDDLKTIRILVSRGDLLFGIPKIIKKHLGSSVLPCIYLIDEIENFEIVHQKYINTLIREKDPEVSIKIGARRYGIKTSETFSAGELLIEGSEKETFVLDDYYRLDDNKKNYEAFLYKLLNSRIRHLNVNDTSAEDDNWAKNLFEEYDPAWNDPYLKDLVQRNKSEERKYFQRFRRKLSEASNSNIDEIIGNLSVADYPLLEKVNIYNFYKEFHTDDPFAVSKKIKNDCDEFIATSGSKDHLLTEKSLHYKNNFIFQLRSEYKDKAFYNGISTIMDMSEGMPRNFLQILKRMYDWSFQLEENPFLKAGVSSFTLDIQRKAIRESADWFYDDVRECEERKKLRDCIERLGQLLRINHFGDLPKECSCLSIAVNESKLSDEARLMIKVAEEYSFIIELSEPHKDKNHSSSNLRKFQMNKMLCPKWDLPLSRRGTKQLNNEEAELIFNPTLENSDSFSNLRNRWEAETTFSPQRKKGSLL